MGNISQSSKRSALKGFDVYFQHEKKMNKNKPHLKGFEEIFKEGNMPVLINYQKKLIAHNFGLVDYYNIVDVLCCKVRENNGQLTLLNGINDKVIKFLLKEKSEYLKKEFANIYKLLIIKQ